jgi:hypothetical protein
MIAGIIGLVLSLAGLVGVWMVKPNLAASAHATIQTLSTSLVTSQEAMEVTRGALGATIDSVDALSEMLNTTAVTVSDTQPVVSQVNVVLGETLPATIEAATDSLQAAQQAATSLEGAIQSFEMFRTIIAAVPLIGSMVPEASMPYNPDKPLADSLGELSASIQEMPATFIDISTNIDKADDNLDLVKTNLETMSTSVALISTSLSQYQDMIGQSKTSLENINGILTNLDGNVDRILNYATLGLGLFFFWLLATQIVIFSQGLELFHGTATRMEAPTPEPAAAEEAAGEK